MSRNTELISNVYSQAEYAAKQCKCPVWVVYLAKERTGSNNREVIYKWIESNRHRDLLIKDFTKEQP